MTNQKWKNMYWSILEKYLLQLQYRTFFAEKDSDFLNFLKLQKLFYNSWCIKNKAIQPFILSNKKTFPLDAHILGLTLNQKFFEKKNIVDCRRRSARADNPWHAGNSQFAKAKKSSFLSKKNINDNSVFSEAFGKGNRPSTTVDNFFFDGLFFSKKDIVYLNRIDFFVKNYRNLIKKKTIFFKQFNLQNYKLLTNDGVTKAKKFPLLSCWLKKKKIVDCHRRSIFLHFLSPSRDKKKEVQKTDDVVDIVIDQTMRKTVNIFDKNQKNKIIRKALLRPLTIFNEKIYIKSFFSCTYSNIPFFLKCLKFKNKTLKREILLADYNYLLKKRRQTKNLDDLILFFSHPKYKTQTFAMPGMLAYASMGVPPSTKVDKNQKSVYKNRIESSNVYAFIVSKYKKFRRTFNFFNTNVDFCRRSVPLTESEAFGKGNRHAAFFFHLSGKTLSNIRFNLQKITNCEKFVLSTMSFFIKKRQSNVPLNQLTHTTFFYFPMIFINKKTCLSSDTNNIFIFSCFYSNSFIHYISQNLFFCFCLTSHYLSRIRAQRGAPFHLFYFREGEKEYFNIGFLFYKWQFCFYDLSKFFSLLDLIKHFILDINYFFYKYFLVKLENISSSDIRKYKVQNKQICIINVNNRDYDYSNNCDNTLICWINKKRGAHSCFFFYSPYGFYPNYNKNKNYPRSAKTIFKSLLLLLNSKCLPIFYLQQSFLISNKLSYFFDILIKNIFSFLLEILNETFSNIDVVNYLPGVSTSRQRIQYNVPRFIEVPETLNDFYPFCMRSSKLDSIFLLNQKSMLSQASLSREGEQKNLLNYEWLEKFLLHSLDQKKSLVSGRGKIKSKKNEGPRTENAGVGILGGSAHTIEISVDIFKIRKYIKTIDTSVLRYLKSFVKIKSSKQNVCNVIKYIYKNINCTSKFVFYSELETNLFHNQIYIYRYFLNMLNIAPFLFTLQSFRKINNKNITNVDNSRIVAQCDNNVYTVIHHPPNKIFKDLCLYTKDNNQVNHFCTKLTFACKSQEFQYDANTVFITFTSLFEKFYSFYFPLPESNKNFFSSKVLNYSILIKKICLNMHLNNFNFAFLSNKEISSFIISFGSKGEPSYSPSRDTFGSKGCLQKSGREKPSRTSVMFDKFIGFSDFFSTRKPQYEEYSMSTVKTKKNLNNLVNVDFPPSFYISGRGKARADILLNLLLNKIAVKIFDFAIKLQHFHFYSLSSPIKKSKTFFLKKTVEHRRCSTLANDKYLQYQCSGENCSPLKKTNKRQNFWSQKFQVGALAPKNVKPDFCIQKSVQFEASNCNVGASRHCVISRTEKETFFFQFLLKKKRYPLLSTKRRETINFLKIKNLYILEPVIIFFKNKILIMHEKIEIVKHSKKLIFRFFKQYNLTMDSFLALPIVDTFFDINYFYHNPDLYKYPFEPKVFKKYVASRRRSKKVDKHLSFNLKKTKIMNTFFPYNGNLPGFDFLGFYFRQYKRNSVGLLNQTKSSKSTSNFEDVRMDIDSNSSIKSSNFFVFNQRGKTMSSAELKTVGSRISTKLDFPDFCKQPYEPKVSRERGKYEKKNCFLPFLLKKQYYLEAIFFLIPKPSRISLMFDKYVDFRRPLAGADIDFFFVKKKQNKNFIFFIFKNHLKFSEKMDKTSQTFASKSHYSRFHLVHRGDMIFWKIPSLLTFMTIIRTCKKKTFNSFSKEYLILQTQQRKLFCKSFFTNTIVKHFIYVENFIFKIFDCFYSLNKNLDVENVFKLYSKCVDTFDSSFTDCDAIYVNVDFCRLSARADKDNSQAYNIRKSSIFVFRAFALRITFLSSFFIRVQRSLFLNNPEKIIRNFSFINTSVSSLFLPLPETKKKPKNLKTRLLLNMANWLLPANQQMQPSLPKTVEHQRCPKNFKKSQSPSRDVAKQPPSTKVDICVNFQVLRRRDLFNQKKFGDTLVILFARRSKTIERVYMLSIFFAREGDKNCRTSTMFDNNKKNKNLLFNSSLIYFYPKEQSFLLQCKEKFLMTKIQFINKKIKNNCRAYKIYRILYTKRLFKFDSLCRHFLSKMFASSYFLNTFGSKGQHPGMLAQPANSIVSFAFGKGYRPSTKVDKFQKSGSNTGFLKEAKSQMSFKVSFYVSRIIFTQNTNFVKQCRFFRFCTFGKGNLKFCSSKKLRQSFFLKGKDFQNCLKTPHLNFFFFILNEQSSKLSKQKFIFLLKLKSLLLFNIITLNKLIKQVQIPFILVVKKNFFLQRYIKNVFISNIINLQQIVVLISEEKNCLISINFYQFLYKQRNLMVHKLRDSWSFFRRHKLLIGKQSTIIFYTQVFPDFCMQPSREGAPKVFKKFDNTTNNVGSRRRSTIVDICRLKYVKYIQTNLKNKYNSQPFLFTRIVPTKSSVLAHLEQLKKIIKFAKTKTQKFVIFKLSSKIREWAYYYRFISNKKILNYCDYITFKMLWKWACFKHSKKSRRWIKSKYFFSINGNNWTFCTYNKLNKSIICLPNHSDIKLLK